MKFDPQISNNGIELVVSISWVDVRKQKVEQIKVVAFFDVSSKNLYSKMLMFMSDSNIFYHCRRLQNLKLF